MLSAMPVWPVLQAKDLTRAKVFYVDKVGLTLSDKSDENGLMFDCGGGTGIILYKPGRETTPTNTVAGFVVEDLEKTMAEMRGKGIKFEDYDFPGLKTENGIASTGNVRSAWFTDSEGNILAVNQM